MLTCIIQYQIARHKRAQFQTYARMWGEAIPRNGAELRGYFAPHEGSATLGYAIYDIPSLAEYEAYRARLAQDPLARAAFDMARDEQLLIREDRTFLRRVDQG